MYLLLLCMVATTHSVPLHHHEGITPRKGEKCGYDSCTKSDADVLNVHIVPHTHDDVGWLKTVDQYYYGSKNNIQKAGVQYIIDSVVKELWEDPKRRFIYVETAFFWKWWVRQPDSIRHKVHTLVRQGRLQFVGGAWSMNDEAASHYQSTIDQFSWGLSKLNQTFGHCALPRVGWQIDPFGHSREFASLLAGMGYDGLFLGRIDYQDKRSRLASKTMEMVWRGDDDLGESSDIFTGILYNTYSPPPGFCFDVLCNDEPIIDDPNSPLYNVEQRVADFIAICQNMSKSYKSNNILLTMGEDFQYQDASMWYRNLDLLIKYTNLKAAKDELGIKLFYSTPNCYLKAVKDANPTLPIKQDDFFPYASDPTAYWTGYFTSRPTTKYFERQGNDHLQMVKQLQVLAGLEDHNRFVLNELKSAMGVMQHHDAVTGTEKQHVSHDYERLLDQAIEDSSIIASQAFNKFMQVDAQKPSLFAYNRCRLNESSCYTSEHSDNFVVTVYNPLGWRVNSPIRIPVLYGTYEVYAPNGDKIDSQLVEIPAQIRNIPTRKSKATHEVVYVAYLHALAYKTFYIKKIKKTKRDVHVYVPDKNNKYYYDNINNYWKDIKDKTEVDIKNIEEREIETIPDVLKDFKVNIDIKDINYDDLGKNFGELENIFEESMDVGRQRQSRDGVDVYANMNEEELRMLADDPMIVERYADNTGYIKNRSYRLKIDPTTQRISSVVLRNRKELKLDSDFYYYPGCVGNNENPDNRSSGAYIFRPNATLVPTKVTVNNTTEIKGDVVEEYIIEMPNALSIYRLYKDLDFIEHHWLVGPIDISDDVGKEYIVRYSSDILNNGEFYTDSNGRQMLKRKLNQRPQWNLTLQEPVAGNYYPVTNKIYIENGSDRVTVITDRAQGGSSLIEGNLELMLHRRLLHDDAFGVGEALNETAEGLGLVVTGKHIILLSTDNSVEKENLEAKKVLEQHLEPRIFVSDASDVSHEEWMKLKKCYSWLKNPLPDGVHLLTLEPREKGLLLRLENYLEKSDNSTKEVDLQDILTNINIKRVKETTLSANQWLDDYKKWSWSHDDDFADDFNKSYGSTGNIRSNYEDDNAIDDGMKIKIKAKQIRTFVVDYEFVKEND